MLGILNHHPVSPMTTLLELVLILHGANASSLLCDHMKSRIFRGSEAVSVVDPYLLLFDAAVRCAQLSWELGTIRFTSAALYYEACISW